LLAAQSGFEPFHSGFEQAAEEMVAARQLVRLIPHPDCQPLRERDLANLVRQPVDFPREIVLKADQALDEGALLEEVAVE
jgi:hypothetical protein